MNDDLEDDVVGADEGFDEFSKKSGVAEKIRGNPAAKVGVVLVGLAVIVGVVMMFGEAEPPPAPSALPTGSDVTSAPGAQEASPAYREAVEMQNEKALEDALRTGSSAIPVPTEAPVDRLEMPEEEVKSEDPLHRWRQMQEERVERNLREQEAVEAVTVLDSQQQADAVKAMADRMTEQMQSILSKNVEERTFNYVGLLKQDTSGTGAGTGAVTGGGSSGGGSSDFDGGEEEQTVIIPTGDIEYAQTLIEASSDIKGPVLAQLLTGPLKGSRLIGSFSVADDRYLVVTFNTAVVDGKDYSIDAIALDPDTTLAGVVTDVDNRYFRRVFLPAAAAFVTGFSTAVAETGRTDVIVSGTSGTATTETEEADDEQRVATGIKEASTEISSILKDMGDVDPIVKIKAGTPIGVLFTSAVLEKEEI